MTKNDGQDAVKSLASKPVVTNQPIEKAIFCQKCGEKNLDTAKFCKGCGHPTGASVHQQHHQHPQQHMQQPMQQRPPFNGNVLTCPNCGSTNIFVTKKGYDAGKACCGAMLLGPFGLLCGADGSNQIENNCLNCKKKFK